jgi:hypothetical protein
VFALNLYRAVTQSLTTDEAYTWSLYLSKNLRAILTDFDANNHVLYTLLSWASVSAFGGSEWAIRLPSVLASVLYMFAAWRLTGRSLLWTAALSLNPLVLDFMSAGRGYGLAAALLLLALDMSLRERLTLAGVAAGLSIAANLSLAFPIAVFSAIFAFQRRAEPARFIDRFLLPMIVTAFILLVVPLAWAKPGTFYVGLDTLAEAAQRLWFASFNHNWQWAPWVLALVLGAAAVRAGMFGALFWGTIALLVAAHYPGGFKYPLLRTGLYLIPLATLVLMRATRGFPAVAVLLIGVYAFQLRVDRYFEWAYDRNTRSVAERLRSEVSDTRPRRVVASWLLERTINYYRERFAMSWMEPVDRRAPDSQADYYVLLPYDHGVIEKRKLRVIWEEPETRIRIAAPRAPV